MEDSLNLIFQEVKERLKDQLLSIDQVATKFNFLLAFNGIIIAAIFGSLFDQENKCFSGLFLLFSVLALLLSALFDLIGLFLKKYRRDPDPKMLFDNYEKAEEKETKRVLVQNLIQSFEANTIKLQEITKFFRYSIVLSVAGLFLIFIVLVMQFGCNYQNKEHFIKQIDGIRHWNNIHDCSYRRNNLTK